MTYSRALKFLIAAAAFGLAVNNLGWDTIELPYVDDNANSLSIRTVVVP